MSSDDVYSHPHPANVGRWEWLTTRELSVRLVERTQMRKHERPTDEEMAELRRKQRAAGADSFAE